MAYRPPVARMRFASETIAAFPFSPCMVSIASPTTKSAEPAGKPVSDATPLMTSVGIPSRACFVDNVVAVAASGS